MRYHNSVIRTVWMTVRRHIGLTLLLVMTMTGAIVTGILPPLALEKIVDGLADKRADLLLWAGWYFVLTACSGLFDAAKESLITVFGQKITHTLRTAMSEKLVRLPASYYVKNEPGTTVSRFVNDVNTVESLFASGVISMAADVCKVISILAVIFVKSRGLGYLLILVTPLLFIMTREFQKRMLQAQIDNRKAVGRTAQLIPETLDNLRTIHVLNKEKYMEECYDKSIQKSFLAMERSNFYDAVYSPIIIEISAVLVAAMMILASLDGDASGTADGLARGYLQLFGMSAGTAVAVIAYVGKVFEPLESIGMEIQNIQSAVAGVKRISEFLGENERSVPDEIVKSDGAVGFENAQEQKCPAIDITGLCFGYDRDRKILHNFNLKVYQGEMVTLAGRTGVGKSTLFKLLLGLYLPQNGQVKVFGISAENIADREKRKLFGYVEQTFRPVPGTVKDQITLKDELVSEEDVKAALDMTGLLEMVTALKDGLDTPFSEGIFSQGQLQLLSIARATVLNPEILLLDEITANLDSIMEKRVLEALKATSVNRTVLSISHRLYQQAGGRIVTLT